MATLARRLLYAASAAFAIVFILALIGSERTASASVRLRVLLLVVFPALSVVSIAAALRWRPRSQARLAFALVAGGVALLLAEVLLASVWYARSLHHGPFDGRNRQQVITDLVADGVAAVPSVQPRSLLFWVVNDRSSPGVPPPITGLVPLGGIARRPTVVCNETGGWVVYESDQFGMNNPDTVWNAATAGVAAVGDAFPNGWCAGLDAHFIHRLRRQYPGLINLGQSGNGPLLVLASLLEYLPRKQPRHVLWFFYELNDLQDLEAERDSPLLMGYLETGGLQNLAERQSSIDVQVAAFIESVPDEWMSMGNLQVGELSLLPSLVSLKAFLTMDRLRLLLGLTYSDSSAPDYELFGRILAKARSTVESWGGELHLVYLPAAGRYRVAFSDGGSYESDRRAVRAIVADLGVDFVDVPEVFAEHGRPLRLFNPIQGGGYGHYTEAGHALVATAILEALEASGAR